MKLQMGTLVLAEGPYFQFMVRISEPVRARLDSEGISQKDYLRDRIKRKFRKGFGTAPDFLFVMEDRDGDGQPVRPHAHGSMALLPIAIDQAPRDRKKLVEQSRLLGMEEAELIAGRMVARKELRAAAGMGPPPDVWLERPRLSLFNHHWVSYSMKNTRRFSATLGDRRLAMSQQLTTRGRQLWDLLRNGQ